MLVAKSVIGGTHAAPWMLIAAALWAVAVIIALGAAKRKFTTRPAGAQTAVLCNTCGFFYALGQPDFGRIRAKTCNGQTHKG